MIEGQVKTNPQPNQNNNKNLISPVGFMVPMRGMNVTRILRTKMMKGRIKATTKTISAEKEMETTMADHEKSIDITRGIVGNPLKTPAATQKVTTSIIA
jgi:hypothetical protein